MVRVGTCDDHFRQGDKATLPTADPTSEASHGPGRNGHKGKVLGRLFIVSVRTEVTAPI
jgi:hypothetical protein